MSFLQNMFYKYHWKIIGTKLSEASHHEVFPGACAQEDPGADQSQLLQGVGLGGDPTSGETHFWATPRPGWQQIY